MNRCVGGAVQFGAAVFFLFFFLPSISDLCTDPGGEGEEEGN